MAQQKVTINGHTVSYDDIKAREAVRYLIRMGTEESKVFFEQAYHHKSAVFEDHQGCKFKLSHTEDGYDLVHL